MGKEARGNPQQAEVRMEQNTARTEFPRLIPLTEWPHPWPSKSAWRHLVFDSERNGLEDHKVILRLGNRGKGTRILIREDRFFAWADAMGTTSSLMGGQ